MLTQPPESTTAALGTNATFSCHGSGRVLWQIGNTQVIDETQVPGFASILQVYVPLPRDSSSELIVTATRETNATIMIICIVDPFSGVGLANRSDPVTLFVYGKLIGHIILVACVYCHSIFLIISYPKIECCTKLRHTGIQYSIASVIPCVEFDKSLK